MDSTGQSDRSPLAALRSFARGQQRPAEEHCDLCGVGLPAEHRHLLETAQRRLSCACDACAVLLTNTQDGRYRRVPTRTYYLADFCVTDAQWDALCLPINLAFFCRSSQAGRILALYPSPAGAAESLLELDAWQDIAKDNPVLTDIEPDVEALLVNRVGTARDYFRTGIDQCYKLVGILRMHWRGLSGGQEVWSEVEKFFAELKSRWT